MLRFLTSVLVALMLVGAAFAAAPLVNPHQTTAHTNWTDVQIPDNPISWHPQHNELNEIIGDTVIVGTSFWDAQHNGQVGRMIAYSPGDGTDEAPATVYCVWTKLTGSALSSARHVYYARIENGVVTTDPGGDPVDLAYRAGYTTLAYNSDPSSRMEFPAFHAAQTSTADYNSVLAARNPFLTSIYSLTDLPLFPTATNAYIWPKAVYSSNGYIHVVSSESRSGNTDPMGILYMRYTYDPVTSTYTPATSDDQQMLVTDIGMNISADIHANDDGSKVAISQTVGREWTIGEMMGDASVQIDNDIYVYESTDGGETWDFDNPTNVTNFIGPDESYLPNDTTAANQDTLRAYTDGTVYYDHQDNLHMVFSVSEIDMIRELAYVTSQIYHWDRNTGNYTLISNSLGNDFIGRAEAWGRSTDRPSLYQDPDTGIMWCVFRKVSTYPDTFDVVQQDDGYYYANSDIYVSASPQGEYNGLLWTKPVNITNTIWPGPDMVPVGESRDEIDPSIALNNDGDSLHIQYLIDLDPGTSITDPAEGQVTNNPIVYHSISKQDLIDIFNENAEWVHNYPMHCDSTGFWQDPDNWEWGTLGFRRGNNGVFDASSDQLQPNDFELSQNYPNPFNPTTRIDFNLKKAGAVKLAVYDVLGREVATLINRAMAQGRHEVTFYANDLPSGVYFYKLTSGDVSKVRKMILMK